MPTYLNYEYIFLFISIKGLIRIRIFFTAGSGFVFFFSRIRIRGKNFGSSSAYLICIAWPLTCDHLALSRHISRIPRCTLWTCSCSWRRLLKSLVQCSQIRRSITSTIGWAPALATALAFGSASALAVTMMSLYTSQPIAVALM